MAILTLKGVITDDGVLQVELPPDAPRGSVDVTLEFDEVMGIPAADLLASDLVGMWADRNTQAEVPQDSTLGNLLKTGAVGVWADRTDIGDSVEFAREIRRKMTKRSN